MKYIISTLIALSMVCMASSVYAAAGNNGSDGKTATIASTTMTGAGDVAYDVSPSTSMAWAISADGQAYTVLGWSSKNLNKDAGMQYLATSSETGIYQKALGASADTLALSNAGSTLADFVQKE